MFEILSIVQSINIIAMILRSTDMMIIGRQFSGGPRVFPGFCNGMSMPSLISFGQVPLFKVLFIILAISPCSTGSPYFKSSALMLSQPPLLLFFIFFSAFPTSDPVIIFPVSLDSYAILFAKTVPEVWFLVNSFSKCFSKILMQSRVFEVTPFFDFIIKFSFFLQLLINLDA